MSYTNQQVFARTGIQVSDINRIAERFGYAQPYAEEHVELMRSVVAAAKDAGVSLKVFLSNMTPEEPENHPEQGCYQSQRVTPEAFQGALATAATDFAAQSNQVFQRVDAHCAEQEEALAKAVVDRFKESPLRAMALTAEKLGTQSPSFFPLAPEGAELPKFVPTLPTPNSSPALAAVEIDAETIQ